MERSGVCRATCIKSIINHKKMRATSKTNKKREEASVGLVLDFPSKENLGLEDTAGRKFHREVSNDREHSKSVDFSDRKLQIGLRD